jgi:hypothetical protein
VRGILRIRSENTRISEDALEFCRRRRKAVRANPDGLVIVAMWGALYARRRIVSGSGIARSAGTLNSHNAKGGGVSADAEGQRAARTNITLPTFAQAMRTFLVFQQHTGSTLEMTTTAAITQRQDRREKARVWADSAPLRGFAGHGGQGRVGHRRVTQSHVSCAPSSNWTCGFLACYVASHITC